MIDTNKISASARAPGKRAGAPLEEVVADHARRDSRVDVVAAAVVDEHLRIVGKHDLLHDFQLVARRGTPEGPVRDVRAEGLHVGGEIAGFPPLAEDGGAHEEDAALARRVLVVDADEPSDLAVVPLAPRDVLDHRRSRPRRRRRYPPLLPRARSSEGTRDRHGAADALGRPEASPLVAAPPPTAAAGMPMEGGHRVLSGQHQTSGRSFLQPTSFSPGEKVPFPVRKG